MLKRLVVVAMIAAGSVMSAGAADRLILGSKLQVSNPTGLEAKRKVTIMGKEAPSDVAALSNPTAGGAMLTVVLNGGTSTSAVYQLDAIGWQGNPTRYRYKGPTGGDGDPVRAVSISRSTSGQVKVKVVIKGSVGIEDVVLVPPNPGTDGGMALAVAGGDRYCVAFGAGAGGNETRDTSLQWKITGAVAQPGCPSSPVATTTTVTTPSSTTTTSIPLAALLCPMDPSRTIFAGGSGTAACRQFDGDQPSCEAAFHVGDCGPASCWFDFQSNDCRGCGSSNEDSGLCTNTCLAGAPTCAGDPSRTLFAGYSGSSACRNLSFSQTLCEQAFHIDAYGTPATCYFDANDNECRGCGPNNLDAGECQNTCPVCEGDPTRTTFLGGPFNAGCHKFDGAQASCEGAFVIGGDSQVPTSCWYDTGNATCNGCGPNNQDDELCMNECPTCLDPSRHIFAGGPFSSACHVFDNSPILCEQSFHIGGQCSTTASCYYDYDAGRCNGCGTYNAESGACGNVCSPPICGNGIVDLAGEQCDGSAAACGPGQYCSSGCQCASCDSTPLPAGGGAFPGTTSGSSAVPNQCGYGADSSPENVYSWTPATSGVATITTCGPSPTFNTVVSLHEGSCTSDPLSCSAFSCGSGSLLMPYVTAGTTYYIVVDGYSGMSGSYTLTVVPASPSGAFLD